MNKQLTVLATAYAVNPYKGSEDGMGWNFALQIARNNRLILVTRQNNRMAIEKYMRDHPNTVYGNIRILYFDLPYWMRFWKKGGRGAMLYFWMWQRSIPSFIKRAGLAFDISHNLNFHNDWTPSYLWKLNKPFVWGPIGHHPMIPMQYLRAFGWKSVVKDRAKWFIKKFFWKFSLSLNSTVTNAAHIIKMNSDVDRQLHISDKPSSLIPSVATGRMPHYAVVARLKFRMISVGRLVEVKGFDLAIHSFAKFLDSLPEKHREVCELIVVGKGPLENHYRQLIKSLGVEKNVKLVDWMERSELMDLYRQSSAFLFPSHEGAGMVVAEALSIGLPVVCLENSGPGEFIDNTCGITVKTGAYDETVNALAAGISKLYKEPSYRFKLSRGAHERFKENFDWDVRAGQLQKIYQSIVA